MDLIKSPQLPQQLIDKYEREASRYWDLFYRRNEDRFFRDRHYFDREFPELLSAQTVLEVGCGVGNTIFPLLELNPTAFIYACDFAPSAVALVRSHPQYASGRVHAFVADITAAPKLAGSQSGVSVAPATVNPSQQLDPPNDSMGLPLAAGTGSLITAAAGCSGVSSRAANGFVLAVGGSTSSTSNTSSNSGSSTTTTSSSSIASPGGLAEAVPAGSVDACCMVFVLSAISPERMPQAIRNIARTLKPGTGQVLFRDYAVGDLSEGRLAQQGRSQRIEDNFYARWDGTRAYYFTEVGLRELFASQGFRCESIVVHERVVENRKQQSRMERRYIQAVFTYCSSPNGTYGALASTLLGHEGKEESVQQAAQQPAGCSKCSMSRQVSEQSDRRRGGSCDTRTLELSPVDLGPVTFAIAGVQPSSAQLALARLLLASPSALLQRHVVATSSSALGLDLLRQNARQNSPMVLIERLRLQQFAWRSWTTADHNPVAAALAPQQPRGACQGGKGCSSSGEGDSCPGQRTSSTGGKSAAADGHGEEAQAQLTALRTAFPAGFDVVAGANLLREGSEAEAAGLASCLAALLSHAPHAVVLLSHTTPRSTSSTSSSSAEGGSGEASGGWLQSLTEAAARVGLVAAELPAGSRTKAQGIVQGGFKDGVEFLCLRRGS
ncbi:hypothetical protein N2152v2_010132 [Parachlorella kessleri]